MALYQQVENPSIIIVQHADFCTAIYNYTATKRGDVEMIMEKILIHLIFYGAVVHERIKRM